MRSFNRTHDTYNGIAAGQPGGYAINQHGGGNRYWGENTGMWMKPLANGSRPGAMPGSPGGGGSFGRLGGGIGNFEQQQINRLGAPASGIGAFEHNQINGGGLGGPVSSLGGSPTQAAMPYGQPPSPYTPQAMAGLQAVPGGSPNPSMVQYGQPPLANTSQFQNLFSRPAATGGTFNNPFSGYGKLGA